MDTDLIAQRCYDYIPILSIIENPVIKDAISEDGLTGYVPDLLNEYWVTVRAGADIIGCFRVHQKSSVAWQAHTFILPKYRELSIKAGIAFYKWLLASLPALNLMYTKVPAKYYNVRAYLECMGLDKLGVLPGAHTKDGELFDLLYYGITRASILRRVKWVQY